MLNRKSWLMMSTAAAIAVAPMVAFGQTATPQAQTRTGTTAQAPDGTAGNPPSTATQRALDNVTGNRTNADGTGNNPPGTALGRAVDRATDDSTTTTVTPRTAQGTTGAGMNGTTTNPAAGNPAQGNTAGANTTPGNTTTRPATTTTGTTAPSTMATGATSTTMSMDSASMREARRASQIIGSNIYNDENDSIGEVDDLIVPRNGGSPVAVISVGGFLGIGAKLVAVPYDRLTWNADRNRWTMSGATKDSLKSLPAFDYDSMRGNG